jgi:hypothetical protein
MRVEVMRLYQRLGQQSPETRRFSNPYAHENETQKVIDNGPLFRDVE